MNTAAGPRQISMHFVRIQRGVRIEDVGTASAMHFQRVFLVEGKPFDQSAAVLSDVTPLKINNSGRLLVAASERHATGGRQGLFAIDGLFELE
jgi:hypothetical protein